MPNIKSAKKRVLVNQKKNAVNHSFMSELRTAVKKFNAAIDTNRIEDAEKLLPETMSIIDSAAAKGIIHKNNAANKKSALSKKLSDVKSGKKEIVIKKTNKAIAAEKAMAAKEAREAARAEIVRKNTERAAAKAEADKAVSKDAKKGAVKKATAKKETAKEAKDETKKPAKKAKTAAKKEKATESDEK